MKLAALALSCVALVTACSGPGPRATSPAAPRVERVTFQPYSAHYYGATVGHIEQEFNGQVTENDFGMRYHLKTDVDSADSGFDVTFVLDSVLQVMGAASAVASGETDAARGATFTATLARNGELSNFQGGHSLAVVGELAGRILQQFFPRIPTEGAQAGMRWTDTLETTNVVNGVEHRVESVNEHEAVEWTTHAGQRALHIITTSSYTFSGAGQQAGQSFTLEGEGRRNVHHYLGDDGRYLGFVAADTSHATADVAAVGIVIPVFQVRADTLTITG